ncbi:DNA repair protein rhp57 [Blastocladiella emersonii ATCC 22665]|nr:DNA repair protein rhp57 [Blastocladiella emersonii ATCC 22665]
MTALPPDLPQYIANALARTKCDTIEDVLLHSSSELGAKLHVSAAEVTRLRSHLAAALAGPPPPGAPPPHFTDAFAGLHAATAAQLVARHTRLATGDTALDSLFCGGLPAPGVVDLAGTSGAGKTQLCLQLVCRAQHSVEHGGLAGGAVYISTEAQFPIDRLLSLAAHQCPALCTDAVITEKVANAETLIHLLRYQVPHWIGAAKYPVRLLVIDSVAALFRGAGADDAMSRAGARRSALAELARTLHKLADVYSLCVVAVNQVSADWHADERAAAARGIAYPHLDTAPVLDRGQADPRV